MAEWRVVHRQGDEEYDVDISWDDDAFVNGTPEILALRIRAAKCALSAGF